MAGLLIDTLPVRVPLAGDRPVDRWLAELQQQRARAREHAHTPLDRVQAWSGVPAGRRLFDSILVVEDVPFEASGDRWLDGLRVTERVVVQQTNYPLTLLAHPGEPLVVEALCDRGQVDPRLAGNLLGHLATVLAGLTSAATLGEVALLPAGERAELRRRGAPRGSFPAGDAGLVPARFAGWARRQPDRVAVSCGDERVTYRELLGRVAALAHRLRGVGAGPGELVGIYLPRGVELVVAVLAVAGAGAGYLPVDRRDPAARARTVLADGPVAVLLTDRAGAADLGPLGAAVVCLDDPAERARLAGLPDRCPPLAAAASDVAYVIYTSGSTGAPKGVVVEHAQLARLFDATRGWFDFGPDDVWTLFHSVGFDFSVWELWGALAHGGRLVVVPEALARDPARFRELLLAEGVTVLNQTPTSFRSLLSADLAQPPAAYRLRHVVLGGERLLVAGLRPWLDRYGDQRPRLVNMYGITETTVHVSYRPITRADLVAGVPSPIGEPIPDLAVRLVDRHGRLVPVGVPGEIQIGGAGVARGYLHRPELTADRFVTAAEDPDQPVRRWYRSGDRARWLPAGGLEYLGRLDDQVKIRGHRIEPGDVESALRQHPQVREAVVAARETGPEGHRQLLAYVVPAPGGPGPTWSQLRGWLSERLPDHLIPAGLVSLDRLPLTRNGKVDRSALPVPDRARPEPDGPVAPRTEEERILAEVWADVLGLERVGTADNFFELGGDSILTIQVVARANRRGVSVTPAQLFAHQTVAGLARVAVPAGAGAARAEQGEVTGAVPATPAQAWFHRLDLPHPEQWNLPVLLLAGQPVRAAWLAEALTALVAHHDGLRLRVDRQRRQSIVSMAAHGPVPVPEVDLTGVDRQRVGARVDELARSQQAGLDLAAGPLLRATVFRTPPGEPDRVLLVVHHLLVDAVSWQLLLSDLDTAYRQLATGAPVDLPAKTTDVGQWSRRLAGLAATDQVGQQARWWLRTLPREVPPLPVEGDPAAPNREEDSGTVEAVLAEPATRDLLTSAHRAYRTRTDELLLAALARAMAGWTGGPRLLVDVEGHGRDALTEGVDVSRTVGWFTTFTPTWLDLSGVDLDDPARVVPAVKEQLRAVPGRGAAYGLARWLRGDDLARELSELPAAQVSFNYLGRLDPGRPDRDGFPLAPALPGAARHPDNPRPYLVDLVAGVREGRLHLYLTYSARHHTRSTMERLLAAWLAALRVVVAHCLAPGVGGPTPSDFPLARVDQAQLDRLVPGPGPVADLYPLSPLQQGLLFHTLANPSSGVYFEQFSIRLDGPLEVAAFEQAWRAVIDRHAVLRAAVAWQGLPVPHLVVRAQVPLPLTRHDWSGLAGPEQAARLDELLTRDRTEGFTLTEAPLTRLHLVRLAPERWRLVWSHHHLLLDGWSVALLIQEVFDRYEAARAGQPGGQPDRPPAPAPPPPAYRDYLAHLASLDFADAWPYWRRVLSGVTGPTPLAADRPGVPAGRRDTDYARVGRRLSAAQSGQVREFARTHRLTLDTVLFGAWALVLADRSGRDDVVFGVTYSGRPPALPGVERMVGLFVNTLPARVRISRDQPVGSWLSGLLREQVQAREYEHTPLDQVKSWTAVPPDRPLFESIQGLENYPMTGSRFRTGSVAIREIDTFEQTNYPLSFLAIPDEQLWLQLWYDALRFTPATAEAVLRMAEALVRELAADPDRTVGEVLALVAARHRPPRRPEPPDLPVPQLVAYWAGVAPDRTAVRSGGARLTYRQLDRRANQVAHALRDAGAGPGTRVGLALPPDVDRVAAMLGILKAGAVCVPLPDGAAAGPAPATGLLVVPDRTGPPPGGWPGGGPAVALGPGERAEPPEARPGPTDPAVVAWWRAEASVSAVELSHGELARQVRAWRDEITGQDVVAQHAEPASDVAAWEVWTALGTGACLALDRSAATVLTATPDEVSELLDRDPVALAPVRRLLVRGELPAPAARRLRLAHPSLQVRPAAGIAARRVAQVLRQLPMVREVVVTPAPDGRQLAAYLVPDAAALDRAGSGAGAGGRLADQHVGYWRTLYDRTYAGRAPADPEFDIVGWRSSYTGGPIADPAMAEWRDRTVERIRALRPARVLEIGCGTGLLLFGLLAGCGQYVGTDFSPVCLAQLRAQLATRDAATRAKVTLLERTGDDLAGLPPGGFDVVVLNSVVQYFPGPDYLARVLDAAVRAAAPAGAVFVGDVRHHGLAEAFQVSVELHRAVDMLPTDELSGRVGRSLAQERELLVDPGYFRALAAARPEIGAVQVLPKRGRHDTELTRYRYDAVLRLGAHPPGPDPVAWYDWRRDVLSRSEIGWLLEHADGDAVGVTGVPNARIAADLEAARLLAGTDPPATAGELRLAAGKAPAGVDPEELYQLGEGCGWTVAVSWAGSDVGGVDVLFRRGSGAGAGTLPPPAGAAGPAPAPVGSRLTNAPLRAALAGELERQAWQALPADAPVRWVRVLDELPRTADGQPDEAALPVPEDDHPAGPAATGAVPPRTADELRLALVWERLLGVSPVDVRTSFFDLGGDSLLAIRAVDEASRSLGREIPMAVLLQEPTVEGMAAALRADPAAWNPLVEVTPGAGAPFFCVHPAGGGVLCYAELARLLAPRPFCALQARGVDDRHPPYQDLPGMAARYLQAVRGRQPTGPYLLGGYSLGGLVAYEMAQQLVRAGERVARLVLVDTPTPDLVADLPDEAAGLARLLAGRAALDPDELRAMPARERLRQLLAAAERARLVPPGMDPDRAQQLYEVYTAHLAAARAYRPQPFGGPTCLVRAGQSDRAAAGHQWGRLLTGPAEVVEVPGDHETVIWPPHVRRLAEVLRGQLAAAQA